MHTATTSYQQRFCPDGDYPDQLAVFEAIGRFIQTTSAAHATQMGLSVNALQAAGLTWVLARQQTLLLRPPSPGAEITIETWPSTLSRLTCRRDFVIWENGETLGLSLTDWAVLNLQTRRAERIPEFIAAKYPSAAPEAMPELNLKPAPLSPAEAVSLVPVRAADIDLNNHVTNTRYVELMLGAVPDAIRRERRPAFCDIVYRAEALAGDRIEIRRQTVQPDAAEDVFPALRACPALRALLDRADCTAFRHSLVKPKTGFLFIAGKPEKELVRGFSLWV